ncbi:MAG: MFS transporter [Nocardiopsaceae bacterium]|nr:MFS transporter [Nocardiopsaceae bacterium]
MSVGAIGDLRAVLAERDFRRLFATRLVSQAGDGVFNAGVGTYVFFSASSYPTPMAGAAAFAVLYVPYSVIGPFAGVLIDRWSRRQILVWSGLLRAAVVAGTAALMAGNDRGPALYAAVLAVLGVSRFLDSALSAALPRVVPGDKLVMANSVSPTVGGVMSSVGGILAFGLNTIEGDTEQGAALTVLAAGACYLGASAVATSMRRTLLGPDRALAPGASVPAELRQVAARLASGARYILSRPQPRAALGATGAFNFLFGALFLTTIILYRNSFYPAQATVAASHIGQLAIFSAAGFACAAVVTPPATRRVAKQTWITAMLLAGAAVTFTLGEAFAPAAYLAIGFLIYLAKQSVAICSTTILQEDVEDAYRGRGFAFYDMMFNITNAAGGLVFASFMPVDGKAPGLIATIAVLFAAAGAVYWLSSGRIPSASAQRRSS